MDTTDDFGDRDAWIARRAHAIWLEAGCPHGKDHDHWHQAVAERDMRESLEASPDGHELLLAIED
jgi:hypothetical protein